MIGFVFALFATVLMVLKIVNRYVLKYIPIYLLYRIARSLEKPVRRTYRRNIRMPYRLKDGMFRRLNKRNITIACREPEDEEDDEYQL